MGEYLRSGRFYKRKKMDKYNFLKDGQAIMLYGSQKFNNIYSKNIPERTNWDKK